MAVGSHRCNAENKEGKWERSYLCCLCWAHLTFQGKTNHKYVKSRKQISSWCTVLRWKTAPVSQSNISAFSLINFKWVWTVAAALNGDTHYYIGYQHFSNNASKIKVPLWDFVVKAKHLHSCVLKCLLFGVLQP